MWNKKLNIAARLGMPLEQWLRENDHLTNAEMAQQLQVSSTTLGNWRRQFKLPTKSTGFARNRELASKVGKKGSDTVKRRYGPEYHQKIGCLGGEATKRRYGTEHYSRMGKRSHGLEAN